MCDVLDRVEAGGLDRWSDAQLKEAVPDTELSKARSESAQAVVLAELARRGRAPEAMFGAKVSPRDAERRTKTAIALGDGSLPGAAEALAAGDATMAHVAALAAIKDRLPEGAAANMLSLAAVLPPDKFARALQRAALPVAETADGSTGVSSSGGRWFRFNFDGLEGTIVLNGLEATMDRQWRAEHPDRAEEKLDRPPYGHRMAAALLAMAQAANAGQTTTDEAAAGDGTGGAANGDAAVPVVKMPPRPQADVMVVITYDKLFADAEAAGICTTIDGVPLTVAAVRKLLVDAKIYPVVMGGDGEVLDFGRGRRFFSTPQKMAAAVRDMSCMFGDCDKPIRYADYHHCLPWAQGGLTDLGNDAPACDGCHDKLTTQGYRLERRNGTTYTYDPNGQLIHQRNNRWQK